MQVMELKYYFKHLFKHEGRKTTQHKNTAMIMTAAILINLCLHLLSVSERFYQTGF